VSELVLGLGGNVGGEAAILARFASVAAAFEPWGRVRRSRVYRTAPIGPAQDDFLNAAIAVRASPEPLIDELAAMIAEIEALLGRDRAREARWGPRTVDVDVLWWGDRVVRGVLEIPHRRLHARRFALAPLVDLVPDAILPGAGRVGDLLARVRDQIIEETALTFG
jgi:2-amino-4-hydroxy-6-hydroxymethyldihydropteridine diphosphokinase